MNPGHVRRVELVVGDVQNNCTERSWHRARCAPVGTVPLLDVEDGRRIGLLRVPHPHPDETLTLDRGIAANPRRLANGWLPGTRRQVPAGSNIMP